MPQFLAVAPPEYLLALGFLAGVIACAVVVVVATSCALREPTR